MLLICESACAFLPNTFRHFDRFEIRDLQIVQISTTFEYFKVKNYSSGFCANRLAAPKRGHMKCIGNGVTGTTCSFSCEENYRIVGSEEVVCVEAGGGAIWSQETPTCERKFDKFDRNFPA